MEFKSYEIDEFNAKYGTSIIENMDHSDFMKNLYAKLKIQYISRRSDDVLEDCENLLIKTNQEFELVEVLGQYIAILP